MRVKSLVIAGAGINNTHEPVEVSFFRQTSAGTMSGLTLAKQDPAITHTLRTTAQYNATVEPSGDSVVWDSRFHPQLGINEPFEDLWIEPTGRLGLVVKATNSIDVAATIYCEE